MPLERCSLSLSRSSQDRELETLPRPIGWSNGFLPQRVLTLRGSYFKALASAAFLDVLAQDHFGSSTKAILDQVGSTIKTILDQVLDQVWLKFAQVAISTSVGGQTRPTLIARCFVMNSYDLYPKASCALGAFYPAP